MRKSLGIGVAGIIITISHFLSLPVRWERWIAVAGSLLISVLAFWMYSEIKERLSKENREPSSETNDTPL